MTSRAKMLIGVAALCCTALTGVLRAQVHPERTVVVISLDGVPAYMLKDPQLPMPTLRKMMREGARAETMLPVNPTITWPNHTSMVTGVNAAKHDLIFNGRLKWLTPDGPPKIDFALPKSDLVHAPTIYDVAFAAGLTTAQSDWPAADKANTITWSFGECPETQGVVARELIASGVVEERFVKGCLTGPQGWRNQLWTDAAIDIIEKHHPNLLLFHLLATDTLNHDSGPDSMASSIALAFVDDRIKQILDALQRADLLKTSTVFVVSDHGFNKVDHWIHPNVVLVQDGLLQGKGAEKTSPAWIETDGGVSMIYIPREEGRAGLIARLTDEFSKVEGISKVYTGTELEALGFPVRGKSDQAPDMLLAAKSNYSFSPGEDRPLVEPTAGPRGAHGYLNTDPKMGATFVAWGNGIKAGVVLNEIKNLDVAPTIANILGLKMPSADGRVLREILE